MRMRIIIAPVALAMVVGIIGVRSMQSRGASNYITAPVKYSSIRTTIQATGTVSPVDEVQVGTQVSGTIQTLNVDFNSTVHKGQVLATLDPTSFQAASAQTHANLDVARAQAAASASTVNVNAAAAQNSVATVRQLRANITVAQANVQKAAALETLSRATVSRDKSLLSQGYISQSQMDTDLANEQSNHQSLRAAQAAVTVARQQAIGGGAQAAGAQAQEVTSQSQAGAAQAQVEVAAAATQQADYNLDRTVIRSPIDGIIVSRNVAVGQTVAASLQTPTLFVIASSLKDMQVDVSVDEADVGQLRTGQAADISVPAFPNVVFHGVVKQVRVNPTTVQNVVTYDAVTTVHDEAERLKPGMTADVSVNVSQHDNVLSVPTAALLYRPSAQRTGSSATQAPVAGAPGSRITLWVLRGRRPTSVPVTIGSSDGSNVQITQGNLQIGDRVIVAELQGQRGTSSATRQSAFGAGLGGRG